MEIKYLGVFMVMYALCFIGSVGVYVEYAKKKKRREPKVSLVKDLKPATNKFYSQSKLHNENIDFLCNGVRVIKNGMYGVFLVVGKRNKKIDIGHPYLGVSRMRVKMGRVEATIEQFLDITNNAYNVYFRIKNDGVDNVNVVIKTMSKNAKTIYFDDHQKYMEYTANGVTESIKCDTKSRVGLVDGGIVCRFSKAQDSKSLFSISHGVKDINLNVVPELKRELMVEHIRFLKKYFSVKDLALINKILFQVKYVDVSISGNENLFTNAFWIKKLYESQIDISKKIYVLDDDLSSDLVKKLVKLFDILQIPVCFTQFKALDKYCEKLVKVLNIADKVPNLKPRVVRKTVCARFEPYCYGDAVSVSSDFGLKDIDIKRVYPSTHAFVYEKDNEIINTVLKEKIVHDREHGNLYKKNADFSLLDYRKFFFIKVKTSDKQINKLINEYLPKMIYRYFKRGYNFTSLYDYVYHTSTSDMDTSLKNAIVVLLRRKQYAKLYHYLLRSLGISYFGDIVKLNCLYTPFKKMDIFICGKKVQKVCDETRCYVLFNGRKYYNICVIKVKR